MTMNARPKSLSAPPKRPKLQSSCRMPSAGRQRGIALLALVALIMMVGAGILIKQVNARVRYDPQLSSHTGEVLKYAKTALIARAVIDANRPGELPCPDVDYDGQLILNTDFSGGTNIPCASLLGWLPWRTLDIPELRDASGARLWYSLSDVWHAGHSAALNPDTVGGLTLNGDATTDIIAVIIAPGADLKADTDPRPAETSAAMNAATASLVQKFLEDANSDGTLTTYVNQASGDFNDRLVIITRAELISALQRRVAGEVAVALSDYRITNGSYPWLSNNVDPLAADPPVLNGIPGVRNGHIAYIETGTTPPETYSFQSGLTVDWNQGSIAGTETNLLSIVDGTFEWYLSPTDEAMMQNAVRTATPTVATPTTEFAGAACDWENDPITQQPDPLRVDCDIPAFVISQVYRVDMCVKGSGFDICPFVSNAAWVNRTVVLNLHYTGTNFNTSNTDGARTREVQSPSGGPIQTKLDPSDLLAADTPTIVTVTDTVEDPFSLGWTHFVSWTMTVNNGDDADFNTTGIYAEPQSGGILPGDLPAWFATNNWGPYLYINYAANLIPTGTGTCTAGTDCINLSVSDTASRNDVEAVVLSAGVALTGQTRAAGSALNQFFEEDNANGNDNVERKAGTTGFNDFLRLIACDPGASAQCM